MYFKGSLRYITHSITIVYQIQFILK